MKPFRGLILFGSLAALLSLADSADAAWNNVFQATFFHRNKPAQSNYVAVPVAVAAVPVQAVYSSPVVAQSSPCCDPCQTQCCQTKYVQRCFYQPVTVMQSKTYYEPVTTMQTSYYYESVCSYKYSCYYDPCSCSYQQVAVPTTSYCLKAKSCPVQSWVQKCCQVPVTSYQKSFYWEPQTTCCSTTSGAPIYAAPVTAPSTNVPVVPQVNEQKYPVVPQVNEQKYPVVPQVNEQKIPAPPSSQQNKYYGPPNSNYFEPPVAEGSSLKSNSPNPNWQAAPSLGTPVPAAKPYIPPTAPKTPVPLDKFASLHNKSTSGLKGQVVSSSNAPKGNTELIFVNASQVGTAQTATANGSGQFQVSLASGQWTVYIRHNNGQTLYHSKIQVNEDQPSYLTLVSK